MGIMKQSLVLKITTATLVFLTGCQHPVPRGQSAPADVQTGSGGDLGAAPGEVAAAPEALDPVVLEQQAMEAILNPKDFNAAVEAARTPEERQGEQVVLWAFEHPDEYRRQFLPARDPAEQKAAEAAILDPV